MSSDQQTEAAAKAVYELEPWEDGRRVDAPPLKWESLTKGDQENYLPIARAALNAVHHHDGGKEATK